MTRIAGPVVAVARTVAAPAAARAAYEPLDQPGAPLSVPRTALTSSLSCPQFLRRGELAVLMSAATPANFVGAPKLPAEPPLACYVSATCTGAAAPTLAVRVRRAGRVLYVHVLVKEGGALVPVPGASVVVGRRRAVTGPRGAARLVVGVRAGRRYRLIARRGCNPAFYRFRITRATPWNPSDSMSSHSV